MFSRRLQSLTLTLANAKSLPSCDCGLGPLVLRLREVSWRHARHEH